MRKYDHLFFDLDNTLWDFDVNGRLALQQAVRSLNLEDRIADFDSFCTLFDQVNTRLWESYRNQEIRHSQLTRERFEIIIDHFHLSGADPEKLNALYLQSMPTFTNLVEGALETLADLRAKGYHLHIITNGPAKVQRQKVYNSALAPYIERITTSEEVASPKPDKRIFQHALKSGNARKKKSLMIGDNWETDILGAMQMGIDHVFFIRNNSGQVLPDGKEPSGPGATSSVRTTANLSVIRKLTDLIRIL